MYASALRFKIRYRFQLFHESRLYPQLNVHYSKQEASLVEYLKTSSKMFHRLTQGCSGAGTRGNGVPTSYSHFPSKWVGNCFKMAIFWMRSHTFLLALHPWAYCILNRTISISIVKRYFLPIPSSWAEKRLLEKDGLYVLLIETYHCLFVVQKQRVYRQHDPNTFSDNDCLFFQINWANRIATV